MEFWNRYWFGSRPLLDLAIVRIICCFTTLFFCLIFHDYMAMIGERATLDDALFRPTFLFKLIHLPFGWGYSGTEGPDGFGVWAFRPSRLFLQVLYFVFVVSGILSAIGFRTNVSLIVFAASFFYIQSYIYSFGDLHHPEAAMVIMIGALALSPSGRVLSMDNVMRAKRDGYQAVNVLADAPFAGWPIRLMQWFFALMYLSAFFAKLTIGGLDWMNGYTLQYYLIQDGLRWGGDLALWLSQYHNFVLLGQIGVMVFQATFFLDIIFPKLRWIYIPIGLMLHISIYVLQHAPFFTWIALYSVFIPWRDVFLFLGRYTSPLLRLKRE